jgi:Flp pilus assembly protein CpaB
MRWSAVGLLALGVVAAFGATHLVTSLRTPRETVAAEGVRYVAPEQDRAEDQDQDQDQDKVQDPDQPPEAAPPVAPIVVALRALAGPTLVEAGAVEVREVPEDQVPEGALVRESEVVGKVLIRDVPAGASFTSEDFAQPGSGIHVASALRPGMRAVGLTLVESMEDLIEPGNVVDVLASVEIGGQPVSMTLLQSVVVLAVGGETLVPSEQGSRESARGQGVVLLVDSKQAEALMLVLEEGSVTLALRNPDDDETVSQRGTRLNELTTAPPRPAAGPVARRPEPRHREVVVMKGDQSTVKTVPTERPEDGN